MDQLEGKRVAILATDGFEQSELIEPREALRRAGAATYVVSPKPGTIRGWKHDRWGDVIGVDITVASARCQDYDALVLPGGVMSPDKLRVDPDVLAFVKDFFTQDLFVAAICHGSWTLIDAGVVGGRKLTSYGSIRRDLENAGANWVDREVVVDGKLITSRSPADLPAFCKAIVAEFAKGPPVVPVTVPV